MTVKAYLKSNRCPIWLLVQVVLDRLAAQELVLLQRPVISGHYSGSPFVNMLSGPLDASLRALFRQVVHMGQLVQRILSEEAEAEHLTELDTAIKAIDQARYELQ